MKEIHRLVEQNKRPETHSYPVISCSKIALEPEKTRQLEREEDVRRHVGGIPLLTDLSLAMRIDPLALIRGVTEFVTVIYGPAVILCVP